jgi:hypothetical protein
MIIGLRRLTVVAAALAAMTASALPAAAQGTKWSPLSAAQLAQLVAPIALYPDPLVGQMLMASTYPLEVVEAARWSKDNPEVSGEALQEAMAGQSWDPSVKTLTALPQILQMMSDKGDWTQQLGDAFLAQQADLLDAIQGLRTRAEAAGQLETTPQQKVAKVAAPPPPGSNAPPTTVYVIEPATSDEYSVPIYDPGVVYGTWPYPDNAPFYWHPPGYVAEGAFAFAAGTAVGAAIWGRVDWWQNRVNVNVNRYNRFNNASIKSNTWRHDPAHRQGVAYPNPQVAERFANGHKEAARADAERKEASTSSTKTTTKTKTTTRGKQATARKATKRQQATTGQASQPQLATTGAAANANSTGGRRAKRRR